jgi:hypothetical protein
MAFEDCFLIHLFHFFTSDQFHSSGYSNASFAMAASQVSRRFQILIILAQA